eukprot:7320575-Ditylum_brightwellii.AAC.1
MAMFSAIEDGNFYDEDWNEIMALLSGVDVDNLLQNINTTHLTDRALAAAKSDTDTPTLMEALMGKHGEEFRAAM